ncbi:MAG: paraquat-inducible protein A [Zetaproteobacteria bacterium]|nr:paraquat-inducible protein A [Zetaproteobacteria bacterium]
MVKLVAFLMSMLSLLLLFPGLCQPILTVMVGGDVQAGGFAHFSLPNLNQTRSILGTVQHLWGNERRLVAFLIFMFSVFIPAFKAILTMVCFLYFRGTALARNGMRWVAMISKWSMCDVFIVAVFLVFLTTGQQPALNSHALQLMGMKIDVQVGIRMHSTLGPGFYYFTTYCLLSILSSQLMYWAESKDS